MEAREVVRLAEFEEWYWWHRGRQTIVRRILQRYAPPAARILDVGCGTGATTGRLRAFGPVIGIDLGMQALGYARARGLEVARMEAGSLGLRDQSFDVVVALDVLEHLDDDVAAVQEIHRALRPGGVLLATVPSYPFLWSSHDVALHHRRRYVGRQLREVLTRGGLHVELCSYVMSSILPIAMAVRLAERLFPRRSRERESGYILLPGPLNSALAHAVGLGGHLVHFVNLPFGLSIAAVGRRPAADSGGGS